ncbi:hypothetical protein AB1K84_17495 [Mesobacillus foraminis]|uniref:hypothetical protein n=1 Tax=Mesobacillus foraminis TaxID=279826 RepID=UPI0039A2D5D9
MDKEPHSSSKQHGQGHFYDKITKNVTNLVSSKESSPPLEHSVISLNKRGTGTDAHIQATLMALADAIIPSTLGALDLRIDDYVKWTLDRFLSLQGEWGTKIIPISAQTAIMLDVAAAQYISSGKAAVSPDFSTYPEGGPFAALSYEDRFQALRLLENLQVDLESLPIPFRNNAGLVQNVVTSLHQLVMFGYYSEWFSFGPTRLAYPENQRHERQRFIWDRLDYPGISFGYRAHRGFLVEKFSE